MAPGTRLLPPAACFERITQEQIISYNRRAKWGETSFTAGDDGWRKVNGRAGCKFSRQFASTGPSSFQPRRPGLDPGQGADSGLLSLRVHKRIATPATAVALPRYRQLSLEERCSIARLHEAGQSIRQIAAVLDRQPACPGHWEADCMRLSTPGPGILIAHERYSRIAIAVPRKRLAVDCIASSLAGILIPVALPM